MNTPINFELAKLLKEKGFDENHEYMVFTSVETEKYPEGELVLKPTIAEVVMWLYKKHGIWIQVFILNKTFAWKVQDVNTLVITCLYAQQDKGYNSPTEAYKAAIEFTLENLI
jgi:hypothetical protein